MNDSENIEDSKEAWARVEIARMLDEMVAEGKLKKEIDEHGDARYVRTAFLEPRFLRDDSRAVDAGLAPPGTTWEANPGEEKSYKGSSGPTNSPEQLTEEEPDAIDQAKQLTLVRELLVKQNADDKLIDAIDQAIADNEFWMPSDPHPCGDSADQEG